MSAGEVLYEKSGPVATLTFNRPQARNAMTWTMYEELVAGCERIDADNDVRVALLRGAGGEAFVSGTDINRFASFVDADDGSDYEAAMDTTIGRLDDLKVPTIAVIDGWAVGGGLAIAAACDWRVATPDSRFGVPIARTIGNTLSMTGYARLVSLIGPTRTLQMILGAGFLSADEAYASGLVTEVVTRDDLDQHVDELAARLASHAPLTMWAARQAVRRLTLKRLPAGDDLVKACYGSADFHEGVESFREKRPARWKGR